MITIEDIANATFRKAKISGYNPDDVNEFLDQVQESFAQMQKEKMDLVHKLEILAKKVEEYREEEESIRNTLFSAQKLADASVREAKHKSEVILKDASAKAERIVANAQAQIIEQKETLERLQYEVSSFRSRLLAIYKEHLTLIRALPTELPAEEKPVSFEKISEEPQERVIPAPPAAPAPVQEAKEPVAVPFAPDTQAPLPVQPPVSRYEQADVAAILEETEKKFASLKFGEDYDMSSDTDESPLGLFQRKK